MHWWPTAPCVGIFWCIATDVIEKILGKQIRKMDLRFGSSWAKVNGLSRQWKVQRTECRQSNFPAINERLPQWLLSPSSEEALRASEEGWVGVSWAGTGTGRMIPGCMRCLSANSLMAHPMTVLLGRGGFCLFIHPFTHQRFTVDLLCPKVCSEFWG